MSVAEVLARKGASVKTIKAKETIWVLAQRLKADRIGALVVVADDGGIEGIVSERDIARGLAEHAAALPAMTVASIMTRSVVTCRPSDALSVVARVMTERRIRHLPVVEDKRIIGLVSIGDILGHRLEEMQQEVNVLRDYAISRS